MHDITKHDSEKEWEGHTCKDCGINLLVTRNTIGINNLLEYACELVSLEECWLFQSWHVCWTLLDV